MLSPSGIRLITSANDSKLLIRWSHAPPLRSIYEVRSENTSKKVLPGCQHRPL
jgi:hypothetical protein